MTRTAEQAAAAHAGPDGAFLIEAGPGTGKTFTMVERFTWLVRECRLPCDRILTVTFTEKAGTELRERITERLRRDGSAEEMAAMESAWIGTFHGTCARLLEENAYLVGAPRELGILDDIGQRLLLDSLRARLRSGAVAGIDLDSLAALGPDDVSDLLRRGLDFVLKLKGRGIGASEFRRRALEILADPGHGLAIELADRAEEEAIGILHAVYAAYEGALESGRLLDFDDLVLRVIAALERIPAFRGWCRDRFRQIVVDEFQDTNRIQFELVRLLAADGFANVTAVGDAKQSIYGWRDAEIENIRSRFPGRRLPLTRNRRSFQEILDCATSLIRRDRDFAGEPDLVAERGAGGAAVTVMMAADAGREARMVAAEIRRLRDEGMPLAEIAVLSHSVRRLPPEFEQELRLHGIPYVTSDGSGFFDREEVKDVVALLRLAEDPLDDGALVRVLQGPVVRLDDAGMYRVACRRIGHKGMRLRDCWERSAAEGHPGLPPAAARRADRVLAAVEGAGSDRDTMTVADILGRLVEETGYLRHVQVRTLREGPRALRNLRLIFSMASRHERDGSRPGAPAGIGGFVGHLDHIMAADLALGEAPETSEAISLLTVHAAKGLEWRAVFLVNTRPALARDFQSLFFEPEELGFVMKRWSGSRDGRHPRFALTSPSAAAVSLDRAERRRVVYVALTRAADRLCVSASRPEASIDAVALADGEDDFFAEILTWALANPGSALVTESEQLPLPELVPAPDPDREDRAAVVAKVIERLDELAIDAARPPLDAPARVQLSFSQLQQFELCPIRYRYQEVWRVPAPPDELLPAAVRGTGANALGAAVHEALRAWHGGESGDLLQAFAELADLYGVPEAAVAEGARMLRSYREDPLASALSLGAEVEFNLRLGDARVRGVVDRVAELGVRTALVDYKTNRRLDRPLLAAYSTQLRLYRLAAERGLLPGGAEPDLLLYDLRHGRGIPVEPDSAGVIEKVEAAARDIRAGHFELGPEHADRPCFTCAYRRVCPQARSAPSSSFGGLTEAPLTDGAAEERGFDA
ncbi:MAG: ATP-dependent helicase [Candidatus Dormibacteraceae bacterium]